MQIAAHFAVHDDFVGVNVGNQLAGFADGEALALQRDRALDLAFDLQIFISDDLAFHGQAGAERCDGFDSGRRRTDRSRGGRSPVSYTHLSDHSAVIIAVGPLIILLLARAMKLEELTSAKIIGMAISFFGVYLLETEQGSPRHSPLLLGDLITLGGTIGFSIYAVLGKRLADRYDAISMNAFNCFAAATIRCV